MAPLDVVATVLRTGEGECGQQRWRTPTLLSLNREHQSGRRSKALPS
jgi:hypothetical protein